MKFAKDSILYYYKLVSVRYGRCVYTPYTTYTMSKTSAALLIQIVYATMLHHAPMCITCDIVFCTHRQTLTHSHTDTEYCMHCIYSIRYDTIRLSVTIAPLCCLLVSTVSNGWWRVRCTFVGSVSRAPSFASIYFVYIISEKTKMNEWVNLVHGANAKPLPQKHPSNWLTFSTMCCCCCCWISIVLVDFFPIFYSFDVFVLCWCGPSSS